MMEFIIVLVVIGILAASVSYKGFFMTSDVSQRAAIDQVVADIRYTQMLAAGSGGQKKITFDGSAAYKIWSCEEYDASGMCTSWRELERRRLANDTPASVASFTFNSLGEKIEGDPGVRVGETTITVLEVTGKVIGG